MADTENNRRVRGSGDSWRSFREMDRLTPTQRFAVMARVPGKDSGAEMTVRRMVHAVGYRFRLHRRNLPGGMRR